MMAALIKQAARGAVILTLPICLMAVPASAQETQAARTPEVGDSEVGQRQTREDAARSLEAKGRIENRIQNRVQNRIRNRIDRYYDPKANATSPFESAEQAREAERPRP